MALNIIKNQLKNSAILKSCYRDLTNIWNNKLVLHSAVNTRIITYSTLPRYRNQQLIRHYSVPAAHQSDADYCREHKITIIGDDIPSPVRDLDDSNFPDYIQHFLQKQGFTKPTVIQSQGWPIAISGKNFVGIAQTGTGKTLAYLLPAVIKLKENKGQRSKGPRALVLAPTRELARQIEEVAKDFERFLNIRCLCIYGGVSRAGQSQELQRGVDILIATPGRLNDFLKSRVTTLSRCQYVVLDEADRMLDMGFEPQIREALEDVPLERQILMFSATWPKEVQHLAKDYLGEFVQVNVGSTELTANHNIKQCLHVCEQDQKMDKFKTIMHDISGEGFGKILVFTNTKRFVDSLALALQRNGWPAVGIHGDKTQLQRDIIINKFRNGKTNILVATDVAARGLDVDGITHVINYDFPNTSEDYIHRIGRTGRSNNKGTAHTILTSEDARQAKSLVQVLKEAKQEIPEELEQLARDYNSMKYKDQQTKYNRPRNNYKWKNFNNSNYNNRSRWNNRDNRDYRDNRDHRDNRDYRDNRDKFGSMRDMY